MKLTFKQFERATNLLESYSIDSDFISDEILVENELTREDLEKIHEGILGDLVSKFKGWIGKGIARLIPGNDLTQADAILANYRESKMDITDAVIKELNKIYKSGIELSKNPKDQTLKRKYDEIKQRGTKAIEAIESAQKAKLEAISKRLQLIVKKSTSDIIKDYIEEQLALIQEEAATAKLEDAKKNSLEDAEMLAAIEKEVDEARAKEEAAKKTLEDKIKKEESRKKKKEEKKGKEGEKKEGDGEKKEGNLKVVGKDDKDLRVGQIWKTKKGNKAEIMHLTKIIDKAGKEKDDLNKGEVMTKNTDSGNLNPVKLDTLDTLVKDVEKEKKAA